MRRKYKDWHKETDGILYKKCIGCEEWIIADLEHYGRDKGTKSGFNDRCKTCQKIYQEAYYAKTREIQIEKSKKRRLEKLPEITEYLTQYYKDNKETIKASNQEYKNKNREYYRELSKKFRQTEHGKERYRYYWRNNRKTKAHKMTDQEWIDCKAYFNNSCAYCGMTDEEQKKRFGKGLHREHVIYDGRNDIKNCVPCCQLCNRGKDQKPFHEFYNKNNPSYSYDKYYKIYMWLRYDYKKYIVPRKVKDRNKLKKLSIAV